jgi:hypothetical protein
MTDIHYDIYLGGVMTPEWRQQFKTQITSETNVTVFDPYIENFQELKSQDATEQIARSFYFMDLCKVIVFYFDSTNTKSARLFLGDAIGRGKQVIVCLNGKVTGKTFLQRYCEYRGIVITDSVEELVSTVKEYVEQVQLCQISV